MTMTMTTSSAQSSAAPSAANTPVMAALNMTAIVMVESPQTSARSSCEAKEDAKEDAKEMHTKESSVYESKRPAPIVIIRDSEDEPASAQGILKLRALRTDGSARLDDDKEVPSIDIETRLYAQSPHPSAIPILSRQSSKGYNLGAEEVKVQTQGFDVTDMFSPTAAGHAKALATKARAQAIAAADAIGKTVDARGRARTLSDAALPAAQRKSASTAAEDGCARDCGGCSVM